MKKLFISQPMNGKSDEEILKEREIAIEEARKFLKEDVEVIDTFYTDLPEDARPLEYIARSIGDLAKADIAFLQRDGKKKEAAELRKNALFNMESKQLLTMKLV